MNCCHDISLSLHVSNYFSSPLSHPSNNNISVITLWIDDERTVRTRAGVVPKVDWWAFELGVCGWAQWKFVCCWNVRDWRVLSFCCHCKMFAKHERCIQCSRRRGHGWMDGSPVIQSVSAAQSSHPPKASTHSSTVELNVYLWVSCHLHNKNDSPRY